MWRIPCVETDKDGAQGPHIGHGATESAAGATWRSHGPLDSSGGYFTVESIEPACIEPNGIAQLYRAPLVGVGPEFVGDVVHCSLRIHAAMRA